MSDTWLVKIVLTRRVGGQLPINEQRNREPGRQAIFADRGQVFPSPAITRFSLSH
jgi:hypothetical protein